MKIIPSKTQWANWTLPSKASYIGVVLALVLFAVHISINLYMDSYKKEADKPKVIIESANKPFLRYEKKSDNDIVFSYELCFQNKGHNTAMNLKHSHLIQKLSVNNEILVEVKSEEQKNNQASKKEIGLPSKLVSGDKYYKIYQLNGKNLTKQQVEDLIEKYNDGKISVILDINIEYEDEITGKKHKTHEILSVHKSKVLIIK